ncbi:glycosyltransferase family 2 protein [Mediterraneibacter gnavus]|uniref:glycosyltransferase family A protein n=1 Tax=Mediterraneibacter gnavus TaxID=33038 RepID=UPI000E4BE2F6|nr:glycosyltransferase family 2 protein [Mediterraneibacter gnavus]RHE74634.1 glycosyltransferase family 2 protein [Mediterraneibacter gnavus]
MTMQVLVSTMNQTDYSLLKKMNIQTDAVVVNQSDRNDIDFFQYNDHSIVWVSMTGRGVGLSRNACLMHAKADIVLFADDDIVYEEGYADEVLASFKKNPDADVVCFNIKLENSNKNIGGHRDNNKNRRLHVFNSMRYGATLIAARRKVLLRERISFSLLFGGGAEFNSGEDSIFVKDCLDAGLKLYSDIYCLGKVDDSTSSWYTGINDKFFVDRGMVYATAFPKIRIFIFWYYALRLSKLDKSYNLKKIYSLFNQGKEKLRTYR